MYPVVSRHRVGLKARHVGEFPQTPLENLPTDVQPSGIPLKTRRLKEQKAMSHETQNTSPCRNQADGISLRNPAVPLKRSAPRSDTDSEHEASDTNDGNDLDVGLCNVRQSTAIARISVLTHDLSLEATAGNERPLRPESPQFSLKTENLQSEADDSGSEIPSAKRRKVSPIITENQNCTFSKDTRQYQSRFSSSYPPVLTNLDASQISQSESGDVAVADHPSLSPSQRTSIATVMPNIGSVVPVASMVRAKDEETSVVSNEEVIAIQKDVVSISAKPSNLQMVVRVIERMRSSFLANISGSETKVARWVTDPANPNGQPIRAGPPLPNDAIYCECDGPNMPSVWRTVVGNKQICTVKDIPYLVAKAYCSSNHINRRHLVSMLLHNYSGLDAKDIIWCLAGVVAKRAPKKIKPMAIRPDPDEAMSLSPSSKERPIGEPATNDCSANRYLSPPRSLDEGSPDVKDAVSASKNEATAPHSQASVTKETGKQTPDPGVGHRFGRFVDPRSGPMIKVVLAYTEGFYAGSLEHEKEFTKLENLAQQNIDQQEHRIRMLQNDIDEITRSTAVIRNRLDPGRRWGVGQLIDQDRVEKEEKLRSMNVELVGLLGDMNKWAVERVKTREQRDLFISNAKASREDIVQLLAFVDALPAPSNVATETEMAS